MGPRGTPSRHGPPVPRERSEAGRGRREPGWGRQPSPRLTGDYCFAGALPELVPVLLPELLPELVPVLLPELLMLPEEPLPELMLPEPLPEFMLPLPDPLAGMEELELAGGVEAGVVLVVDGCFAQAVNSIAAASALRATFIFIDNTPDKSESYGKTFI